MDSLNGQQSENRQLSILKKIREMYCRVEVGSLAPHVLDDYLAALLNNERCQVPARIPLALSTGLTFPSEYRGVHGSEGERQSLAGRELVLIRGGVYPHKVEDLRDPKAQLIVLAQAVQKVAILVGHVVGGTGGFDAAVINYCLQAMISGQVLVVVGEKFTFDFVLPLVDKAPSGLVNAQARTRPIPRM